MFRLNSFDSSLNPPSFAKDSQIWQSIESGETQDRSAWENGYVLTENLDGTITAQPKYTSGIPPLTLRKVPIMTGNIKTFESPTLGPGGTQQLPTLTVAETSKATISNDNETVITTNPYLLSLVIAAITVIGISTGFILGDLQKTKKHRD